EFKDISGRVFFPPLDSGENGVSVKLPPGDVIITGEFYWNELPSDLPVPQSYGLYNIRFEGSNLEKLDFVRLESSVRFQDRERAGKSSSINLKVFRKIVDGSPLVVSTLLRLQISGGART